MASFLNTAFTMKGMKIMKNRNSYPYSFMHFMAPPCRAKWSRRNAAYAARRPGADLCVLRDLCGESSLPGQAIIVGSTSGSKSAPNRWTTV